MQPPAQERPPVAELLRAAERTPVELLARQRGVKQDWLGPDGQPAEPLLAGEEPRDELSLRRGSLAPQPA
jgi:hypothetical protein